MGYLEGMLGGFVGRKRETEAENMRLAEASNAREAKVYEALINSPDPEIQSLAVSGLLSSAAGPKRKGGLRGWLGEMESNPILEQIRGLIGTPVQTTETVPGTPTLPSRSTTGYVTAPPAPGGSLAQSDTSATQVGAPPLTALEPPPQPGAPPVSALQTTERPAEPTSTTRTVMRPRQIFQSPEQQILARYSAQERGEILGVVSAYEAVGVPHEQAVQRAIDERMRSRGAGATGYQSVPGQMPDGSPAFGVFDRLRGKYLDPETGQSLDGFQPRTTTGSVSLGQYYEQAARALGFKSGALAPVSARPAIEAKARELAAGQAGAVTTSRGEAAADVPLSTQQRFQATTDLSTQWTKATANRQEMQRQFSLMQTGLSRYDADPIGGSQAVLVTFQKVLDPTSVVRESEYARSPQGLAVLDRLEGLYEKYQAGGAGVPKPVLAEMVETARQFLTNENMKSALDNVRQRLYDTASSYQIDPRLVLGIDTPANPAIGTAPPGAPAGPAGPGPEWQMIDGVLHHNGKPY